ncbi:hypothetical protein IFM47457_04963 [Aspergillus lentulus]|nr:hypothetical protein IFM47457_04963 [Aspergillus lentulus]
MTSSTNPSIAKPELSLTGKQQTNWRSADLGTTESHADFIGRVWQEILQRQLIYPQYGGTSSNATLLRTLAHGIFTTDWRT